MRDLIVTENITLDGVIAPMDGWFDPAVQDDDLVEIVTRHREAADALVLGRVTYEEFASYWPDQVGTDTTGVAEYLDKVAKYVVTGTLQHADWPGTTILRGPVAEELTALKRAPGRDIVVTGSATLVPALLREDGLVDVLRLFVYPVVQGYGQRLFDNPARTGLTLVESRSFKSGMTLLSYRLT